MERKEYLQEDRWRGSFYEISLELGPAGDDKCVDRALRALWSRPEVCGPWLDRSDVGAETVNVSAEVSYPRLYGSFVFDDGRDVGCMSHIIRVDGESDWLDFSIPTGMLEYRFKVLYPLDRATNPWMVDVDEALARVGSAIYDVVPYKLGILGEETSGAACADELTALDCERVGFLVPASLWRRLKPKREAILISNELIYAPCLGPHITYGA